MIQGIQPICIESDPRSLQVLGTVSKGLLPIQGRLGPVALVQKEEVQKKGPSAPYPFGIRVQSLSAGNETGWDLGPLATQPLVEQQNTKKLYETKINCMHAQLGQILDKGYKETKKYNCHF